MRAKGRDRSAKKLILAEFSSLRRSVVNHSGENTAASGPTRLLARAEAAKFGLTRYTFSDAGGPGETWGR